MYESISKNNELENEMTLDISYFWYSAVVVIKCPSMKASDNNPSSYYSGHYCYHGFIVQAISDVLHCFNFLLLLFLESLQIKLLWSKHLCQLH